MEIWLWNLIPWGYRILLHVQEWRSPLLDQFFSAITFMGTEWFYLGILPLLYWSVSKEVGLGATYALLVSTYLNDWLKHAFSIPRPDNSILAPLLKNTGINPGLDPLFHEDNPSFPSNHAQGSVVLWGYLAWSVKKSWFWPLAIILMVLIAASRIYGGVHFPQDVLAGILLGLLFLFLWQRSSLSIIARLGTPNLPFRVVLALVCPLIFLVVSNTDASAQIAGTLIGMGVGYQIEKEILDFDVSGPFWKRAVRTVVGLTIVLLAYLLLRSLFEQWSSPTTIQIFRTIRYAFVGFSATLLAPFVFVKTGLAGRSIISKPA